MNTSDFVEREYSETLMATLTRFVLVFECIAMFPGSLSVLYLTLKTPEIRNKTHNYFVFSLALSDLAFTITTVLTVLLIRGDGTLCYILGFFTYFAGIAGLYFPVPLAVNRFYALHYYHLYNHYFSRFRTICMCLSVWFLCLVILIPAFFIDAFAPDIFEPVCGIMLDNIYLFLWFDASCIITINASMIMVGYCNMRSISYMKSHQNNQSGLETDIIRESRGLVKMLTLVFIIPFIAQTPNVIIKGIHPHFILIPGALRSLGMWLFLLPCIVNPYIILVTVRPYRVAAKKLLKFGQNQNSVHPIT